jgi:Ca-activated chloride channel family protein
MRDVGLRSWSGTLLLLAVMAAFAMGAFGSQSTQSRPRRVTPPTPEQTPAPKPQPAENKTNDTKPPAQTPQSDQEKKTPQPARPVVEESGEAIRISSNLVSVPVSVTNAAGQPVKNLTLQQFQLDEEGQKQTISLLGEPGKTPVDLALLFDVSGSVHEKFRFEQEAAAKFLRTVAKPDDLMSVFSIALRPRMVVARTPDLELAVAGTVSLIPTKEPTAFFDTVGAAAEYLGKNGTPGARRVIIVISDGEDNQSERFLLEETLKELQRNDCLFYSINPSGPSIRLNKVSQKGQDAMIALAAETGGVAFLPEKLEDLDNIFRQIAGELQAQYILGYYSTNEATDGKFRRITARIAGHPELRVRARQGYYAPRE